MMMERYSNCRWNGAAVAAGASGLKVAIPAADAFSGGVGPRSQTVRALIN